MALQKFVVKEGCKQRVGNTYGWLYSADHTQLVLSNMYSQPLTPDRVVWSTPDIVVTGDWIGKEVAIYADGSNTTWLGEVMKPNDPKRRMLWDYGFIKSNFIHVSELRDFTQVGFLEAVAKRIGQKLSDQKDMRITTVQRISPTSNQQEVMIGTVYGKPNGEDKTVSVGFINPAASLEDAIEWERLYTE